MTQYRRPQSSDVVAVVPGYRDLFGGECTFEDLLAIVQEYSVTEWLSVLSRMQTMIAPPRTAELSRHLEIFKRIRGPALAAALAKFEREAEPGSRILICGEMQLAVLQTLVILYAPEGHKGTFEVARDFDAFSKALLITWDLMHPNVESEPWDAAVESILQIMARMLPDSADRLASRAVHVFQLNRSEPSATNRRLRELFHEATGFELADYILGGLSIAVREYNKTPDRLAETWDASPNPEDLGKAPEVRCLRAFYALRCASLGDVRSEICETDGRRSVSRFSLIGLSRYPMIHLPGTGRFVLSLSRLAESLFGGVRHAVISAIKSGRVDSVNHQGLGGIYGRVLEEYVYGLLRSAFKDRFVGLEKEGAADGLILSEGIVVIVEIKVTHYRGLDHKDLQSLAERQAEVRKLYLEKAVKQISRTICALRRFEWDDIDLPVIDWTNTKIVPVIITLERLPLVQNVWNLYEDIAAPLKKLPLQDQLARVGYLSVGDVEHFPDLAATCDVGRLLLRWANDPDAQECQFSQYVNGCAIALDGAFLRDRSIGVLKFLGESFGLDVPKIGRGMKKANQ